MHTDGKYNVIWPAKVTDDDWRRIVDCWIAQYFKRTNYYKIGGKPVLSIYDVKSFIKAWADANIAAPVCGS